MKQISKENIKIFQEKLNKLKKENSSISKSINYLEKISKENKMQLFYFGGFLRDLWLNDSSRDLDIVFNAADKPIFDHLTKDYLIKKTRFGGSKLLYKETIIDAWEVHSTNTYKNRGFSLGPCGLPETTFFNISGIVLEVFGPDKKWGWENGFFKGCENKNIDIQNLGYENAFPELQIIRTIELKNKLGWKLGNNIKNYLIENTKKIELKKLSSLYSDHYGKIIFEEKLKKDLLSIINE